MYNRFIKKNVSLYENGNKLCPLGRAITSCSVSTELQLKQNSQSHSWTSLIMLLVKPSVNHALALKGTTVNVRP